jgi:hypothetical protein
VIGQQNDAEEWVKANEIGSELPDRVKYNWGVALAFQKGMIDRSIYEQWIKRHFHQFRRPEPWLEHVRRYRFSYGTRLHGNISAMLGGVRATWIVHDMRLKEVCDHFCLPAIGFDEVRAGIDLQTLYDRADFTQCHGVYPERYRALYEYVDAAGLPHCLPAPIDCGKAQSGGMEPDLPAGTRDLEALVPQVA